MSTTPSDHTTLPCLINRWQQALESVTAMTAAPDVETLARTIETAVRRNLNAGACIFMVFDPNTDQMMFEAPPRPYHHRKPTSELDGLSTWLSAWSSPAIIADVRTTEWTPLIRPGDAGLPLSALIVPQHVDDTLYGLLVAFSRSSEEIYAEEDLELALALTRHACFAVKHALHYDNARREMLGRTALYEVGKRITSSLDIDEVFSHITDSMQMVVPFDAAVILLLDEDYETIVKKTVRGYNEQAIRLMHLKVGEGISGWAAKAGQAVIVPDVRKDSRYVKLRPETRSEMAVPMIQGEEVIGVFNIENDRLAAYDYFDLSLMEAFASQATIAIQNARLHQDSLRSRQLEKQLEVAGEIQRALLPRGVPSVQGLSLTVHNQPSAEVGGDLYDILTFSNRYLGLAVGDVAGKGVPGAIMMASLYTAFHEYATDPLMTPSDVMERVNDLIHDETAPDRFATLFYGVLSLATGTVRYCSAGHTPPILCRANGTVEYLDTGGLVLGPFPHASYKLGEIHLAQDDILVLYTDGVTEARNAAHEEFGLEGLAGVIQTCPGLSAEEVKLCLTRTLQAHTAGQPQRDDITIIILKVNEGFHRELMVM